ncbi:hypothetical protein GH714_041151 [Hevea brasiliensis]|uniref:BRO1 domain-containing protein n=1 Tax=Hevea brasiliensis TaxID=3981 RepID=A0A6A6MZW6_HEVBR|nr:hypothetical protein GH714_041151 [Hevea brasiliensis]
MAAQSSAAATTNIMLAVYEKKTTSLDLYRPLRNYICMVYSEREAQNLDDDLQTLKQYRSDLERQSDPSPTSRRDLLQNYFKALCLVGLYYEEALAALNVAPLKDHFDKPWIAHVQLKAALFYAEACYRYGLELHEKEEVAEEIARLRSGISALAEAKKNSKGAAAQLLEAISKLEANINRNLERAVKENDRVYLMRIPSQSSLPLFQRFQW